jgi:biopolymer transport protein ExbB
MHAANFAHYFHQSDPVLSGIFWLLAGLSILTWFVFISKAIHWLITNLQFWRFFSNFGNASLLPELPLLKSNAPKLIMPLLETAQQLITPSSTLHDLNGSATLTKEISADLFRHHIENMRMERDKGLPLLASTASAAPFIGLLGTVWGVYRTLADIASQQSASLSVVSGPMGEALVATAFGLFVAIPALVAFNALGRLNSLQQQKMLHFAERLQHRCLVSLHLTEQNVTQKNASSVIDSHVMGVK